MLNTVTEAKNAEKNQYGELIVDFREAINVAYPEIEFTSHAPGCWGANPDIFLDLVNDRWVLDVPDGRYSSNKHKHTAGHGVLAIENARDCQLNLAGKPLYLLTGRAYNGDYRSLQKTYFLFGQNEDGSFFLHKVRPCVGQTGDLNQVRAWIWGIKEGQKIAARQGDLAFIESKPKKCDLSPTIVNFGNHAVACDAFRGTKTQQFVLNPVANHGEHDTIRLKGWFEVKLGKAWGKSGKVD